MSITDRPKRKIDYPRLYKSWASMLYDFSNPVMTSPFRIGPDRVVFGPLQFIHTSLIRAKYACPLLKNLALEALQSITDAHRV